MTDDDDTDFTQGIIEQILPLHQLHLLCGKTGTGKTTFLSTFTKHLKTGGPMFGHPTHPPPFVGYVAVDRPWNDARHWFRLEGLDMPHVSFIDDDDLDLDGLEAKGGRLKAFKRPFDKLRAKYGLGDRFPPGSLVLFDPIPLFLSRDVGLYTPTALGMSPVAKWLLKEKITVLGTCHSQKQKKDPREEYKDTVDKILGSTAVPSYSGTKFVLERPEDGHDFSKFTVEARREPASVYEARRGERGLYQWPFTLQEMPTAPYVDTPEDVSDRTLAFLPTTPGELTFAELVAHGARMEPPISKATVCRYLKQLQEVGLLKLVKKGVYTRVAKPTES